MRDLINAPSIMQPKRLSVFLGLGIACCLALAVTLVLCLPRNGKPLATALLADGRVLQVEGVTFGTRHLIGRTSVLEPFSPWLPNKLNQFFEPKYPRSQITSGRESLVVWVNAVDPATGKHVDCQGIRVEFVDKNGDLFGQESASWFGSPSFWRVGHIFNVFPRTEPSLTLRVTPWRTNGTVTLEFKNPHLATPAAWTGRPLPQYQPVGELEVGLTDLVLRTNGGPKNHWQTQCRFWEPAWEVRKAGTIVSGWEAPQWTAEDPVGNYGHYLGVHERVLKFSASFYPYATNTEAAGPVAASAPINLANLQSNQWWGIKVRPEQSEILVLGVFPAGTHVFSGGAYQTNPPVSMGPVRGGAPSGWVGQSQRVSPSKVKHWAGHYTRLPVIYIRAPQLGPKESLAIRLRDEQGRYWPATAESQGNGQGIYPFMFEVPPDAKTLTAELVILHPIEATFLVNTAVAGSN